MILGCYWKGLRLQKSIILLQVSLIVSGERFLKIRGDRILTKWNTALFLSRCFDVRVFGTCVSSFTIIWLHATCAWHCWSFILHSQQENYAQRNSTWVCFYYLVFSLYLSRIFYSVKNKCYKLTGFEWACVNTESPQSIRNEPPGNLEFTYFRIQYDDIFNSDFFLKTVFSFIVHSLIHRNSCLSFTRTNRKSKPECWFPIWHL